MFFVNGANVKPWLFNVHFKNQGIILLHVSEHATIVTFLTYHSGDTVVFGYVSMILPGVLEQVP